MQITFDVPARPAAARDARRALDDLRGRVDAPSLETLKLLVTELVTNSLRHCKTSRHEWHIHVNVEVRPGEAYVEVCDPGPGFEIARRAPSPFDVSGRGLLLVDRLSRRWGILGETTSCVWFELATGESSERLAGGPDLARDGRGS